MISRRVFIGDVTAALLLAARSSASAEKIYRIGFLATTPPVSPPVSYLWSALIEDLRARDWVEGRNIVFEQRFSEGQAERFRQLAAELVRLKVDVIVTSGTPATLAAKKATATIPIVMAVSDAVAAGLVASFARPGGNVTGTSWLGRELNAKRLELFKEAVPNISRVAVLFNSANPAHPAIMQDSQAVAKRLGIALQFFDARSPDDFPSAFVEITRNKPDGLFTFADPLTFRERVPIVEFAARSRLPAIYEWREFVDAGGLIAYGVNLADLFRRVGEYVDKILRGSRPADLPVAQVTRFELVINLKTAKALGLTIPQSLLLRADEVIQ